ncbi:MAG: IS110 family transposase [Alphaproteobacteria bacterium]|nr:MAG: IS110 family transposase [Alphaproteobacteria bacterium]
MRDLERLESILAAPRRHQSGTSIDYEGRISKQGHVAVREAPCEAAASLLLRVRKWSALRAWGLRIGQTVEHAVRDHCGCSEAGKHSASDVGQRDRLPRRFRRQGHVAKPAQ